MPAEKLLHHILSYRSVTFQLLSINSTENGVQFPQSEQLIQQSELPLSHPPQPFTTSFTMFGRATTSILAIILFFVAFAAAGPLPAANDGDCDTGAIQCCNQVQTVSIAIQIALF